LTEAVSTPHDRIRFSRLPYLIRDRAVSYAYSATLLFATAMRPHTEPGRDFLGVAPGFESGIAVGTATRHFLASNGLDTTASDGGVAGLPGSRQEIEEIRALFAAGAGTVGRFLYDRSSVLLGRDATEDAVYHVGLQHFRYVHFATHGFANESDGRLSGLLLSPPRANEGPDGILRADETYGLELNADLVVLSACETGIGKLDDGRGIMGLSRGFLFAGARNLVVSLWPSDDFGTKYLMVAFYRHLLSGASIRDAMRAAKLELVAMGDVIAKPYYWSPFIQIGSG
jgi:CHAT domain-containing protein